jgi:hypothetical protein
MYLQNVAELMTCLQHASAVGDPLSCSFSVPMICASEDHYCFIVFLVEWTDSTKIWKRCRGSGYLSQPPAAPCRPPQSFHHIETDQQAETVA